MRTLALVALLVLTPTALALCGGTFNAYSTKQITSPNYPSNYDVIPPGDPVLECDFIIVAPGRNRIDLELVDADLGTALLQIYQLDGGNANTKQYFLDSDHVDYPLGNNGPFRSRWQEIRVHFTVPDDGTAAKGFRATIRLASPGGGSCGGAFVATTSAREVTSPNYPVYYDMYRVCAWVITAPEGRTIDLTFHDMSLHGSEISIYSGIEASGAAEPIFTEYFQASKTPPMPYTTRSMTNGMTVVMYTSAFPARGFRATYKLGCGGNFSADTTKEIMTPNYPGDYDPVPVDGEEFDCFFQITAPAGYWPVLTIQDVELITARIRISDGPDGRSLHTSRAMPLVYTSAALEIRLMIQPDNTAARGFKGDLRIVPEEPACGGDLSASSRVGQITSPYYPAAYPNSAECSWVITAPEGNSVTVTFLDFSTERGSDYVYIFDGPTDTSPSMGSFSGSAEESGIDVFTSTGSQMLVYFSADSSAIAEGFRTTYVSRDIDECATGTHECNIYAVCTNTNGGYTCKCTSGYEGDGETCTDVDECTENPTICGRYDTCRNINGGYRCLDQSVGPEDVGEQAPLVVGTYFRTSTPPSEYLLVAMLHERELNDPNLDLVKRVCRTGSTGIYTVLPGELIYEELQPDLTARRSQYFRASRYRTTNSDIYAGMWGRKCFAARGIDAGYMDTYGPEFEVILAFWARKAMRRLYNNYYYVVYSSRPPSRLGMQLINDVFKMGNNKQGVDLSTRTIFITATGESWMVNDFVRDSAIPYPKGLDLQEVLFGTLQADPCDISCLEGIPAVNRHGECGCNCIVGYTGKECDVTDDICSEAVQKTRCENGGTPAVDGDICVCLCPAGLTGTACTAKSAAPPS